MEKGVGVRGSAAGMGCVRVRVGSGFSLSFLFRTSFVDYVFRTFGSGFMCFFSLSVSLPQMHGSYVAGRGTER